MNNIKETEKVKEFCEYCGGKMLIKKKDNGFDTKTGEVSYKYSNECSRRMNLWLFLIGSFHSYQDLKKVGNDFTVDNRIPLWLPS